MLSLARKTHHILLGGGFAIAAGIASNASAETASSDLEIRAGITEALVLQCDTNLSFGITRVNLANHDSNAFVQVKPDGTSTTQGSSVTAGSVTNGVCTMSGSQAAEGDPIKVSYAAPATMSGKSNAFSELDAPTAAAGLSVDTFSETGDSVDANGGATIRIGGLLTIPSTVDADAMGGYTGTVKVTVNDGFNP